MVRRVMQLKDEGILILEVASCGGMGYGSEPHYNQQLLKCEVAED